MSVQKVLVVGGTGLLGVEVCTEVARRGHDLKAPSHAELDITDPVSVSQIAVALGHYDWCVNCAGYTAVDKAETEVQAAYDLNAFGVGYLAGACALAGIKLIHISTDFVFDGAASTPYTESAPKAPLGVYGLTKAMGEESLIAANENATVVRTSWLFGPHGTCFPKTMIRAWEAEKSLRVVSDQFGCPTYTPDLARTLVDLIERNPPPDTFHACGPDVTNWHDFAVRAISSWRDRWGSVRRVEVVPISTADYPTAANRPKYSVLDTSKIRALGVQPMRPLSEAILDFVRRLEF